MPRFRHRERKRSDPEVLEVLDCFVAYGPRNDGCQFFVLSTSAPFLIHGIMSRSLAPISSIGCVASLARVALNEVWLTLFSSIQSRAKRPDWMSASTRRISFLVSSVMMRGPETYSPYSAVLEIEYFMLAMPP